MNSRLYVISDLHLTDENHPNSLILVKFLDRLAEEKPSHLILLGDIFDLWIGDHKFFHDRFHSIVDRISNLVRLGVSVFYFEGNHDLYLRDFWQEKLGVHVFAEPYTLTLANSKIRLEHGDYINPEDKGYLFLRRLLRRPAVRWLAKNLPEKLVQIIGENASHASRNYTSTTKAIENQRMVDLIRQYANLQFERGAFDYIVTGHVHILDEYEWIQSGRRVRSINLGSWFDKPKALLIKNVDSPDSKSSMMHEIVFLDDRDSK